MLVRIVAAAVGLALLLPALLWGGPLAVELLIPLCLVVCLDEYTRMAFPDDRWPSFAGLSLVAGAVYAVGVYASAHAGLAAVLGLIASLGFVLFRPEPISGAADRVGRFVVGWGWIAGSFATLTLLRKLPDGLAWVFLALSLAWFADTGAYFAGRFFGRHKLYERISPKKTWEGYVGGLLCTVGGVFLVRALGLPMLSIADAVVLGVVVGTAGVLGDLAESMLKRAFDVKDSGTILPGHGGLLDRVDAVMFVAPLLLGYASWVKGLG